MTFGEWWTDTLANKAFLADRIYEADFRMCWQAAMEEAAKIAENTWTDEYRDPGTEIASAIREAKDIK